MTEPTPRSAREIVQTFGLFAGPVLGVVLFAVLPPSFEAGDEVVPFTVAGRAALGLMAWMATWWLTEAVHVSVTALLPVAILPLVTLDAFPSTSAAIAAAASPYADPMIGLFLGGFLLALAMQRWMLDRRIALITLRLVGTQPHMMIAGFMLATAVLSMFVSNTATAAMMLPIALSVIDLVLRRQTGEALGDALPETTGRNFALCLMLGIAYAASIGGVGTIIGTPPNVFLVGFLRDSIDEAYRVEISFARWMLIGLPLVVVFLPVVWLLLTRVLYPIRIARIEGGRAFLREQYRALGPAKRGEWAVFIIFTITALMWIFRGPLSSITLPIGEGGAQPLAGLTDAGIAMLAGLALFVVPVKLRQRVFVLDWETARNVPWGILILFGGGLSLAGAVQAFGVGEYIGSLFGGVAGLPPILVVAIVAAVVVFLTELTSNTATTATLLPILAAGAPALGVHPYALTFAAALAASCAFMMPVATPPNAIVFGSGYVTIPQMARAGLWLNILSVIIVTLVTVLVALPLLGAPLRAG